MRNQQWPKPHYGGGKKNEGNKVEKRVVGKVHGGVFAVVNTGFWREAMRVVSEGHVAVYACSH